MNLKAGELINFFEDGGFVVDQIKPVENMPHLLQIQNFPIQNS